MPLIRDTWVDEYRIIAQQQSEIAKQQKTISKWVAGFIAGALTLQAVGLALPYLFKPL